MEVQAIAEQLGRDRSVSAAHDGLAQAAVVAGDVDSARAHFEMSLRLIRPLDDVDNILRTLSNQAAFAALAGEYDHAAALLAEGARLADEAGAVPNQAEVARAQGLLDRGLGRLSEAAAAFSRARELFASFGADIDVAAADLDLAWVQLLAGDPGGAADLAHSGVDRLSAIGGERWVVEGLDLLAAIAHAQGDDQEAEGMLDRADGERSRRGMARFGWAADQARELRSRLGARAAS
jgi:tetratricopeptide (TPR) repeat protein